MLVHSGSKFLLRPRHELKPRVLDDGKTIITMNWFIHLPGSFSFFSRLFQPLLMMTNLVGIGSSVPGVQGGDIKPPSWGGLLQRCFQVIGLLPSWFHLLRRSLPGAVQVSPLWEVQLGFRTDQGTPPRGQVILWDASRGHFADVVGDQKALEKLGREIATRQAVATKLITSAAISETGGIQKAEGGPDPRSMSLERCYEVLKLCREDMRAAQSVSKEDSSDTQTGMGYKPSDQTIVFFAAARRVGQDAEAMALCKLLVDRGIGINHGDELNQTALFYAARQGHANTIRYLISKGAKPDAVDKNGETAMFFAVLHKRTDAVKALLEGGALLEVVNNWHHTCMSVSPAEVLPLLQEERKKRRCYDEAGPGPKRRRTAAEELRAWADEWPIKERAVVTGNNRSHFTLPLVQKGTRLIAGYVHAAYSSEEQELSIAHVKVDEEHMGQGLGGLLLDAAEQHSQSCLAAAGPGFIPLQGIVLAGMLGVLHLEVEADKVSKCLTGTIKDSSFAALSTRYKPSDQTIVFFAAARRVGQDAEAMALFEILVERGIDLNHRDVAWSSLEVKLQGQ
eukprot:s82_g8.t1